MISDWLEQQELRCDEKQDHKFLTSFGNSGPKHIFVQNYRKNRETPVSCLFIFLPFCLSVPHYKRSVDMSSSTAELVKSKLFDLSAFLVNNQVTLSSRTCQQIYATLPTEHRSVLRQLVFERKRKTKKATGQGLQKLFHMENVEPTQELRDRIEIWVKDFGSFFQDPVLGIETNHYSLSVSFQRIAHSAETWEVAKIRRRFDLESIYKRVVRSGHHTGTGWRNGGSTRLAQQLHRSPLIKDSVDEIIGKLERYTELGRSWHLWAERLGGSGFFIVLPQTVAEGS